MKSLVTFDEEFVPLPVEVATADVAGALASLHLAEHALEAKHEREVKGQHEQNKRALLALVEVADALERIISYSRTIKDESPQTQRLIESVDVTRRLVSAALEKWGVRRLHVLNKPFDALQCVAVSEADRADLPEETVVEELVAGYSWNSSTLRAARVTVSRQTDN